MFRNATCTIPFFVIDLIYCTVQKSFIKCPTEMLIEEAGCKETRNFVENPDKCSYTTSGMNLIHYMYWHSKSSTKEEDPSDTTNVEMQSTTETSSSDASNVDPTTLAETLTSDANNGDLTTPSEPASEA